jgi:hypothetical protein
LACNTIGTPENAAATDKAMLELMIRLGVDLEKVREKYTPEP